MSDQRLRELERAALEGDAEVLEALREERARHGVCMDCGSGECKPDRSSCGIPAVSFHGVTRLRTHLPPDQLDAHAWGTRARTCLTCMVRVQHRAETLRPFRGKASALSRAAIELAVLADPCTGRRDWVLRQANPFPPRPKGGGDGFDNARTTWGRLKAKHLAELRASPLRPVCDDPSQGTLFR